MQACNKLRKIVNDLHFIAVYVKLENLFVTRLFNKVKEIEVATQCILFINCITIRWSSRNTFMQWLSCLNAT